MRGRGRGEFTKKKRETVHFIVSKLTGLTGIIILAPLLEKESSSRYS